MAISDRITSIEEHIKESYQELEGIGIDTTGINKNLENIPKLIDGYWETLPKVTGEGTTITLDNTKEGKMKINLKGNTSQEGTPTPETPQDIHVVSGNNSINVCGKNLFDESYYNNYNLYRKSNSYYSYIEMPDSFKTKFYGNMSLKGTAQDLLFGFSTTNNSVPYAQRMLNAGTINSNIEYDFTNATNVYLIIGNGNGITLATDIPKIFENYNIMVSTTSNEPYEAYKGASYPINLGDIELCKIGNYQDKIDKSTGKNLLDLNRTLGQPSDTTAVNTTKRLFNYNEVVKGISSNNYYYPQFVTSYNIENQTISMTTGATATYSLGFPIKIKANTTYTMSFDKSSTNGRVQLSYYASDGTYLNYESQTASFTFTTPSNCDFILINFTGIETNTTYTFTNCRLNEGSTALPYEPYGTGWYVKKEIGKVVYTGASSESWSLVGSTFNWFAIRNDNIDTSNYATTIKILCDYYKARTYANTINSGECTTYQNGVQHMFAIKNTDISSVENFKTWLSSNNVEVRYVLATPTYTEITDSTLLSQLEALEKGKSYTGQTNISQNNNDLASLLNATALEEM